MSNTTKKVKMYGTRWAITNASGKISRDLVGHRAAVYATRTLAKEALAENWTSTGVKLKDLEKNS